MAGITISDLKAEFGIHWDSPDTESRLERYINEGKNILNDAAGASLDFDSGTNEGRLLIAYVEYAYNKKGEYFKQNYASDLLQLRLKHQAGGDIVEN